MTGARKCRLNIICWNNGVGLSRDMLLLARGLEAAGFEVALSPIGRGKLRKWFLPTVKRLRHWTRRVLRRPPPHDVNIMLEHIREEDLGSGRVNLFIPNPEWCLPGDVRSLQIVDGILTKTAHASRVFEAHGCRQVFIGFTSEDRFDPAVARKRTFFHLAGRSSNKGTERLIGLWRRHPEWPSLTIVQSRYTAQPIEPPVENIVHLVDYLDDAELRQIQNAHRFHLCPSQTEGFGHYLVEAMSVGALTITTDAPPMNELVTSERGLLVPYAKTGVQHLARTYDFDETAMESAVQRALAMPEAELQRLGEQARAWFLANHQGFPGRLAEGLTRLVGLT